MPNPINKQRNIYNNIKKHTEKKSTKVNKSSVEKDFDKYRHEIYKFGLTGLDKKDQIDARVELAIKLGAKSKSWISKHQPLGQGNIKATKTQVNSTHSTSLIGDLAKITKRKRNPKSQVSKKNNKHQNGKNRKAN